MKIDTVGFLGLITQDKKDSVLKLGTMSSGFVVFDGETVASGKQYAKLKTGVEIADGRVLLVKYGGTYIILGNIER